MALLLLAACRPVDAPTEGGPVAASGAARGPAQALAVIEARAARDGWDADLYHEAGDLHAALGDQRSAAALWSLVQPPDAVVLRKLAAAYIAMQAWPPAVTALRDLLNLEPAQTWAHFNLGLLLAPVDPLEAEAHLVAAAEDPAYAGKVARLLALLRGDLEPEAVGVQVGLLLMEMGDLPQAEAAFRHAALINDPYPEALAYTGLARARQGKDGSAWIDAALNAGDGAFVRYAQALYLRELRDFPASLDALALAVDADPTNPVFMAELATAYRLAGDIEAAEYWLRTAVTVSDADPAYQQRLARFYAEEGYTLTGEGLAILAQASRDLPDDPDVRASYGWALHTVGRTEEGLDELQAAFALAPENATALYFRGRIALDQGNLSLAFELLSAVADSVSPYAVQAVAYLAEIESRLSLPEGTPEVLPEATPQPLP